VPELQDVVISQRFWHKDFENFLSSQFGNQDYVGHFVLDAHEQYNASGIRVFEDHHQDAGALDCKMPIGTYRVDNKVMLGNCCPLTLTDLWLYFQELLSMPMDLGKVTFS